MSDKTRKRKLCEPSCRVSFPRTKLSLLIFFLTAFVAWLLAHPYRFFQISIPLAGATTTNTANDSIVGEKKSSEFVKHKVERQMGMVTERRLVIGTIANARSKGGGEIFYSFRKERVGRGDERCGGDEAHFKDSFFDAPEYTTVDSTETKVEKALLEIA